MKISIESPEKLTDMIWKKLLTCGIEKVDGWQCNLSFKLFSHYICILSLLMHFIKHLSTSIIHFNNTISKEGGKGGGGGGESKNVPKLPPALLNETLM